MRPDLGERQQFVAAGVGVVFIGRQSRDDGHPVDAESRIMLVRLDDVSVIAQRFMVPRCPEQRIGLTTQRAVALFDRDDVVNHGGHFRTAEDAERILGKKDGPVFAPALAVAST